MNTDRPNIPMKFRVRGKCIAVLTIGSTVSLWFDSPTGDASDSQIFDLQCVSPEQAEMVANLHREVWGLDI